MSSMIRVGSMMLLYFICCWSISAETRHIHLLKIMDTQNADYVIREGCRSIDYGIAQEIELLRAKLGITQLLQYDISGADFRLDKLDEVLSYDMEYLERDIVIVVYVGHGFRDVGTSSEFPNLYFNSYTQSISYADIQERILEKKPSILINMVIACNVTVQDKSIPPPYISINEAPPVTTLKGGFRQWQKYQELFADSPNNTKVIDLVSADKEFYTFISIDGGIFFNEILYAMQEVMSGEPYANWDKVCSTIKKRTKARSDQKGMQQQPYCNYYVRLNPIEVSVPVEKGLLQKPSACKQELKGLRRGQRQELKNLRRHHRDRMKQARQQGASKSQRKLMAREQKVELQQYKLRHIKTYQRRLLQCQ